MIWLLDLWPKVKLYALAVGVVLVTLGIAISRIRAGGAKAERLEQLQARLNAKKLEAKVDADISAITAAERRDRLRKRWSRR
jgi:hypothetical protein